MANFTFSKVEYLKMLDKAMNGPVGGNLSIDRLLEEVGKRRLGMPNIPRIPQNLRRIRG